MHEELQKDEIKKMNQTQAGDNTLLVMSEDEQIVEKHLQEEFVKKMNMTEGINAGHKLESDDDVFVGSADFTGGNENKKDRTSIEKPKNLFTA